jgi:hypothetical protein
MHLQQLTSMPFTSYMRQCLVGIQEEKSDHLDDVLACLVKAQCLAERVAVLKSPQLEAAPGRYDSISSQGGDHDRQTQERAAALAGCQDYLDRLVRNLRGSLKANGTCLAPCMSTSSIKANSSSLTQHAAQHRSSSLSPASRERSAIITGKQTLINPTALICLRILDITHPVADRTSWNQGLVPVLGLQRTCFEVSLSAITCRLPVTLRSRRCYAEHVVKTCISPRLSRAGRAGVHVTINPKSCFIGCT